MKFYKTILSLLAILICTTTSFAQVSTIASRKFDADDFLDNSLSLNNKGIIMYGWEDKTTFTIKQMDTTLADKNAWKIVTEKRTSLIDIKYSEDLGVLLVLMKASRTEYILNSIDIDTKKKKATTLMVPKGTDLSAMILNGGVAWFIASAKKETFLFKCPLISPKLTPLNPQVGQEKINITTLENIENNEMAMGYFYGPKKHRAYDMAVLSQEGKIIVKGIMSSLSSEEKQLFIDGTATRLGKDDYAITGTYNKKGRSIGNGVYFARYSDNKIKYMSKFDYSDFEHFYDYMSEKYRNKIESKIAKKKDNGKNVTINSLSIMHKAILTEKGLVFIGEYYYPTYRTEYRTTTTNGVTSTTSTRVFDGYQYTHGMAIGISNEGAKMFDLHIPMNAPYKPYRPVKFLRVISDSSSITLFHTSGRTILSSIIRGDEIGNNEYAVITDIPEDQKVKWSASSGIYWYENYFFILELQRVKEKGFLGKRRTEFFAVKVAVE